MASQNSAYDMNENGSAKDPAAFRAALRADAQRMAALQVSLYPRRGHEPLRASLLCNPAF